MACIKGTQTGEFTVEEADVLRKLEYEEERLRFEKRQLQEELEKINNKLCAGEHDSDTDFCFQQRFIDTILYQNEALQEEIDTPKAQEVSLGSESKLNSDQRKSVEMICDVTGPKNSRQIKPNEFHHPDNKDNCRFYL